MNQDIFTESRTKSSEFNQPVQVNNMLKYILTHRILLVILIFKQRLYCCDCLLAFGPDSHLS